MKKKKFKEISNLRWLTKAYMQFATEKELKEFNICKKLASLIKLEKLILLDKFFIYSLSFEAKCELKLD